MHQSYKWPQEKRDISRALLWSLAVFAAVLAAQNAPDLIRYLKIRSM
jgi:hypothetical protein